MTFLQVRQQAGELCAPLAVFTTDVCSSSPKILNNGQNVMHKAHKPILLWTIM